MGSMLKPYRTCKPSGVEWLGDVPEHWEVRRLGQIGRFSKGNGGNKEDGASAGVPCVRYGDLYTTHTHFILKSRTFVSTAKAKDYTPITFGDVLFAASGETIDEIGKSAVNLMQSEACCGGDVILFRPERQVEARYMGYATDCRPAVAQKATMGRGITVKHIYGGQLKYLTLALPPLPEQAAIVRFLDHADRRIRRYIRAKQKLLALLQEERKKATIEAIHSPNTTSQRLEVVATLIKRPIKRTSDKQYTPIGLYNRGRGIFRKETRRGSDLGDSDFFWIEEGDLVISGQFAWEGAVALASNAECGCVASHRYPILRGIPNVLDSWFLLAFFQTDYGQLLLDHHSRGAAGRNRPLNPRTLLKEKISLPPFRSQLWIVEMLQRESYAREQVGKWSKLLSEYRTRLIADVVTGKLDVREAAAGLPEVDPLAADDYVDDRFNANAASKIDELDTKLEEAEA